MNVSLHVPDELADRLSASGDLERQALEALAVEAYRGGRLTKPELRKWLGFATRGALDGFLKARNIYEPYAATEVEQQCRDVRSLGF